MYEVVVGVLTLFKNRLVCEGIVYIFEYFCCLLFVVFNYIYLYKLSFTFLFFN